MISPLHGACYPFVLLSCFSIIPAKPCRQWAQTWQDGALLSNIIEMGSLSFVSEMLPVIAACFILFCIKNVMMFCIPEYNDVRGHGTNVQVHSEIL